MPNSSQPWWLSQQQGPLKRGLTRFERLTLLDITELEFQLYHSLFLTYRRKDTYSTRTKDRGWPQCKHSWNDGLILRHLCGHVDVAIPFADPVDQIVLDIDYHDQDKPRAELEQRVRSASIALPGESLIYQSSGSGGVRMIWFLKEPLSRITLNDWTTARLAKAGVIVKSGVCEVRLGSAPDRLPFGRESMLLDPVTLEPLYDLTLSDTLKIANEHRKHHAISPPLGQNQKSEATRSNFNQRIKRYLKRGLPPDEDTNECLKALAWHGRAVLGHENTENIEFLRRWIQRQHNGNSTRINDGKIEAVYRQIERIVKNLKVELGAKKGRVSSVGLSEQELLHLIGYPGNFKTIQGTYAVLCIAKAKYWRQYSLRTMNSSNYRGEEKKIGTNKCGMVFSETEDIPNGAWNFRLYIDLPKELLRRLKIPNASNTAIFVRELERIGILAHKRKPLQYNHKARQFWVNFPFDAAGQPLPEEFDSALWTTVRREGIERRFTPYQAERIADNMKLRNAKGRA